MGTLSKTCGLSRWEILNQLLLQFGDVEPFLRNNDVGSAIRPKLLEILAATQKRNLLRTGLAGVVDSGEHFVKVTYQLEGNGPLVLAVA